MAEIDLRDDLCEVILDTAGSQNQPKRNEQKSERHQAGDALAHATLQFGELEVFPDDVVRFGCLDHLWSGCKIENVSSHPLRKTNFLDMRSEGHPHILSLPGVPTKR